MNSGMYGETRLQYSSKENVLSDISAQIQCCEKEIKNYAQMDPNEVPEKNRGWGSTITVKEMMEHAQTDLKNQCNRRDKIVAVEGTVVGISVGYHDEAANVIFQNAVKSGAIEIIEEN